MRHGAADGNAELFAGKNGCRTGCTADVSRPGTVYGCVHVVGAAGTEIGHGTSIGSFYDTLGLGGDKALMVNLRQHCGFDELGVD